MTLAIFSTGGTSPDSRLLFISDVRDGARTDAHLFSNTQGIPSLPVALCSEREVSKPSISWAVAGTNASRDWGFCGPNGSRIELGLVWSVTTPPNWSANWSVLRGTSVWCLVLPVRRFITFKVSRGLWQLSCRALQLKVARQIRESFFGFLPGLAVCYSKLTVFRLLFPQRVQSITVSLGCSKFRWFPSRRGCTRSWPELLHWCVSIHHCSDSFQPITPSRL